MEDGEYNVRIVSGDEIEYLNLAENEVYDEIEERLGILALRLGYKPQGMELEKVYIDETMGEAQMEFYYEDFSLKIYENKQNNNATFNAQFDGEIVEVIESFYYNQMLDIMKIDRDEEIPFYTTKIEQGNAYYHIVMNGNLKEFEKIVQEIFFESV